MNNMKTILVTGGCGFLGSNMCNRLVKEGHLVICLDNLYTGYEDNISDLFEYSNFHFINHDIIIPFDDKLIQYQINEIYNFACPASPPKYQQDSIYTLKVNFQGVLNLLELAKKNNAKILQTSTSEIYGEPERTPQSEDYRGNVNTVGIRSCYDEGKRVAETLMMDYHKQHNVDTRIVRIFNTYGPKMDKDDGRVVSNFINQCLENKDITLYGDGKQTRSFCYVDDQIEGLIRLMKSEYVYPMNIGNPNEITVTELASKIIELTGSSSKLVYMPLPQDDPTNRKPDIRKANEILKWKPVCCLDDGLKQTISYFK
jgi:UDP-glucuronate decarboxylase